MKKNILKKLLLFGFILFQFGCNLEEEFVTERNYQENIKIRYLYGKEALKKGKNLEAKMMTSNKINVLSRTNISLSTNEGVVDYTKVLEVIDENNIVNYTFAIKNHPDDSETVFHNLVLSNENSNDEEILLLRYESDTPNTSIINFIGTITTKSISSSTNPCDASTSDADFTGATGSDNGSATGIPGDNNVVVEPPPIGTSGWGGGGAGNNNVTISDTPATYTCNTPNCGFSTTSRWEILDHETPQGFTTSYSHRIANNATTNPCDPNGNIGIINDSVVKTPCDLIKKLKLDTNFKNRFANMVSEARQWNFEKGLLLTPKTTPLPTNNFDFTSISGEASKPTINFTYLSNNIGMLHTHFGNLNSVFSADDLRDLYRLMKAPGFSQDFFFGLATKNSLYKLQIQDVDAFIAFGDKYLSDEDKIKLFKKNIYFKDDKYNLDSDDYIANDKNFTKMMKDLNMGVALSGIIFESSQTITAEMAGNLPKREYNATQEKVETINCY